MPLAETDPSTTAVRQTPPAYPSDMRDRLRTQRAHAYLRRRVMNGVVMLGGEGLAWLLAALAVNALVVRLGGAPVPWASLGLWLGGYALFTTAARVQPGWGLGIVAELQQVTTITVLLLLVFTLNLELAGYGWAALLPGALLVVLGLPAVLLARSLVKGALLRAGAWGVPVVVYGAARTGEQVIAALQAEAGLGYRPVAVFDDDLSRHGTAVQGVPVVGDTSSWSQAAPVAIIAMPGASRARLVELLDGPLTVYRKVILIADFFEMQSLWVQTSDLGGILGLQITHNLADPLSYRMKRGLDLLAVLVTLPLWAPLCALIAGLIWLEDRENPFFAQTRVGLGGRVFRTWKFRTMVPNAEAVLRRRLAEDPALNAEWQASFKLRHDPRITRVGRFLRRTSLDELPQLVNVLRGEMALVGPRPLPLYHFRELPPHVQRLRHEVQPGMTGLWQVSGRSDAGNEGMIRLDPYYVRNWSVWLDLVILLRTFRAVLRSAGAY